MERWQERSTWVETEKEGERQGVLEYQTDRQR
ncbi:uncharacterized, partial [Tachysurus ichikawai]